MVTTHSAAGRCRRATVPDRQGITLFEVVLALAIFVGAVASITQVLRNGSRASIESRQITQSVLRAETRMNEIVAGALPLVSTGDEAFEDDPQWTWSLTILDSTLPDLLELQVTVRHTSTAGIVNETYVLNRLMRDPQVFFDAALETESSSTSP